MPFGNCVFGGELYREGTVGGAIGTGDVDVFFGSCCDSGICGSFSPPGNDGDPFEAGI